MKSIYIHIPFCNNICSYCDFCKMIYKEDWVNLYLEALKKEIEKNYKGEIIQTLYIGGGTPSCLNLEQLNKLFSILSIIKKDKNLEFTFECNPDVNVEKIKLLKENGVNRISIGVQTIKEKNLKFLNRNHSQQQIETLIKQIKKVGIKNINLDLMYAFPKQTFNDLKKDLEFLISLDIPHISTYSLMIEPNTILGINKIKPIDEERDFKMYQLIEDTLEKAGFIHYEVSNYSKDGYESKHNLTYWNNQEYYGFGLGASGYINNVRYDNTKSLTKYLKGEYYLEGHELSLKETIENNFILGFRKLSGISISYFKEKYNIDILELDVVKRLLNENKIAKKADFLFIPKDKIYVSNQILVNFIDL